MKKTLYILQSVAFILLLIWVTILIISFGLNYKVSSDNLIDDLSIITNDTTINKWIDIDEIYSLKFKDKQVDFHIGVTFIPSENSVYMKTLKQVKDD